MSQSVRQSIHQTVSYQSFNKSSVSQSVVQKINQSVSQTVNQSDSQPISQMVSYQSVSHFSLQPINSLWWPIYFFNSADNTKLPSHSSVSQLVIQSPLVSHTISQSVSQSESHQDNQSVHQTVRESVNQSDNQSVQGREDNNFLWQNVSLIFTFGSTFNIFLSLLFLKSKPEEFSAMTWKVITWSSFHSSLFCN